MLVSLVTLVEDNEAYRPTNFTELATFFLSARNIPFSFRFAMTTEATRAVVLRQNKTVRDGTFVIRPLGVWLVFLVAGAAEVILNDSAFPCIGAISAITYVVHRRGQLDRHRAVHAAREFAGHPSSEDRGQESLKPLALLVNHWLRLSHDRVNG